MNRNAIVILVTAVVVSVMIYAGAYKSRTEAAAAGGLKGVPAQMKGKPAPDFSLKTLDGREVKLSDYRGKAVLVNFWATWCGPCKIEMPWLVEFEKKYQAQGFEIIGVAMDDSSDDTISSFIKDMNVNYTVVRGREAVGEAYGGVLGLPTSFFVDRNGNITEWTQGLASKSEFDENIQKALATQPSSSGSTK
jgi:thiol-disulfide isomerase/thioredoxin